MTKNVDVIAERLMKAMLVEMGMEFEVRLGMCVVGYSRFIDDVLALSKCYNSPLDVWRMDDGTLWGQVFEGRRYEQEQK